MKIDTTVTTQYSIEISGEEIEEILLQHIAECGILPPNGGGRLEIDFDVSSGGMLRGASVRAKVEEINKTKEQK